MTKKILITGGKGMLGRSAAKMAGLFPRFDVRALGHDELDVTDEKAVMSHADWVAGGWIFHCAAKVNVEGCAQDPEGARNTIVGGTRNAAKLALESGARLLYPQSFLVYDAKTCPIAEDAQPSPLSLYGELKYEAENIVAEMLPDPLMIRMAGFFGGEAADKNFVGRIIPVIHKAMMDGAKSFDVGDRVWQPTWTDDLAYNALHMMDRGASGYYQMACLGSASFAELAHEITVALGWSAQISINTVSASAVSGDELGKRPDAAILSCKRLADDRMNLQRSWQASLHAYLRHPYFDTYRLENQI
ncbi:SDR family oxidoreductase [Sphingorhabdus arenilitoris]|uniref:dTDP-4-dehydrorhamnose reductase n=1 Tax=Sphingorhabdus arenilitoris TaxID=1490041 RepID=A0ABV8RCL2_9SPHN